jgi:hypothetical protein
MSAVVFNIESNVRKASGSLSKLYQQIQDTEEKAASVQGAVNNGNNNSNNNTSTDTPQQQYAVTASLKMGNKTLSATGTSTVSEAQAKSIAKLNLMSQYEHYQKSQGVSESSYESSWLRSWQNKITYKSLSKYAKGTVGTKRNGWAITDESQFGEELVLVPGKDGNLSFMRKGTGVVPADMTEKLWELAQIPTSDLMRKNITAIVPDITKNDIKNEFNFDSLVHVDHCDQNTLKDLEKMVDTKINDFSKQMNYSLKRFAR